MTKVSADSVERSGNVQVLGRAVAILNHLAQADGGASLTEVGNAVGLAASTTHRLLTSLESERYVRFDSETKLWSVGVQAFIMGNGFLRTRDLVRLARPHMRALMEASGETVNLAIEDQGAAVYLSQVECREMMRTFARLGARVPMHCSGVGKALLSAMDAGMLVRHIDRHGLPRMTARTITNDADLKADLAEARRRGYAIDDEEHAVGLRCVAAPIFNEHGDPVGAVSLSGPMARITDARIATLGALAGRTASRIMSEIGGNPPAD
ncbi:IclR family transcriptional regulator [Niveispirillum sp.]|uniref:IclR family transcriptional regulator n=1 Tax=Niveispirillum sp. TaxID=1917217 RepID=UPI001B5B3C59|nr:IclR family transcriptional regulator C-terminal domain-containing protein [Niveispirillum sp.]MBP7339203.1 helix-turn-helix domain-containing protein [Niveispirillum sp.]